MQARIDAADSIVIDSTFEEMEPAAAEALACAIWTLRQTHAERVTYEAEQKRIADERAELARLRKDAAERAAADAERERRAKAERDAEAEQKAAQDKLDAERARQQEELRKAQEPAPVPAVSFANKVTGEVLGPLKPEVPAGGGPIWTRGEVVDAAPPTRDELIAVIAGHYFVEPWKALEWLSHVDWRAALSEAA